ncbi:MBL fold metallo-hydrolase [Metabacillus endolithicus]|uniref:MBL fold metallo-hydrolase n=1 Tax=Metabacillus endolithicus TaxID=1535204 RepID=A0ABW5BXK7_9BACI|nr:MBL fold metallo-hydrolase [Metabacillus endolithicus]UPG65430.1 MBL fold metallo-hydrolase [Metabacillus endolithicus]
MTLKRKLVNTLLLGTTLLMAPVVTNASPGGLDSNGGHTCRTNCSQYGLENGEYHYHRNGEIVKVTTPTTNTSTKNTSNVAYQDAVNHGKVLNSKLSAYHQAINSGDIAKINGLYDAFTKQLKLVESKIGKVSGSSNRSSLNEQYVRPAKIAIERTIYEVSQYRLLSVISADIANGNIEKAISNTEKLERLKDRADEIKDAGGYQQLPSGVNKSLRASEANHQGNLLTHLLATYNEAINSGDIYEIDFLYDQFTKQLRITELKIGQVSGPNNRTALNEKYITPAKISVERTIYEVSQLRLMYVIVDLIESGQTSEIDSKFKVLDRLKNRADEIKDAGGYKALPSIIKEDLEGFEGELRNPQDFSDAGLFEAHFIDVGQGDSTLLVTPNGKTVLIDGGKESEADQLIQHLTDLGIQTIDLMVATHPDADHIGGLVPVLEQFEVKKVVDSGKSHTTQTYMDYLALIDQKNIPFEIAQEGSFLNVDSAVTIEVLNSLEESSDTNDSSVVLKVSYDESDFLLTGDADAEIEAEMMAEGYNLDSEVLKVGHHGSDTSTSQAFLEAVNPIIAAVSVGDNSYGHPAPTVMDRLTSYGVELYTTLQSGDIIITTDGQEITVYTER